MPEERRELEAEKRRREAAEAARGAAKESPPPSGRGGYRPGMDAGRRSGETDKRGR